MIRRSLLAALLVGLLAGCGGGGGANPGGGETPIGENRLVAVVQTERGEELVSYALGGGDRIRHAVLDEDARVLDVAPSGGYLLVARFGAADREELYLTRLDGISEAVQLTEGSFRAIESAHFNDEGTSIVCAGIDDGGQPVLGVASTDGTVHEIEQQGLYGGDFLGDGRLAVLVAEEEGNDLTTYIGVMNVDGTQTEALTESNRRYSSIDASGDSIVAIVSPNGDEDPRTEVRFVVATGGEEETLAAAPGVVLDPRLASDGQSVYAVRAGTGIVRLGVTTAGEATVVGDENVVGLVAVR
ncbi:MAG: hypothetical protein ACO1SV_00045 [Fimbriimonas sp.]